MMDMGAGITIGILLGGVLIAGWVLYKTKDPDPEKEFERGYEDAKHFHTKKGVTVWAMEGFVRVTRAMERATAYEDGMQRYVDEVLKRVEARK